MSNTCQVKAAELEQYLNMLEEAKLRDHRKLGKELGLFTMMEEGPGLWETSGHWDHYRENMYTTVIDETEFAIKPMNCPGGMLVYKMTPRSG